jgi:hypothetical protein
MSVVSCSTTNTTAYKVTADTTGTLVLQTGATPTTAVTVDASQNVGIGTNSPSSVLDVLNATPKITLRDAAGRTSVFLAPNSVDDGFIGTTSNHSLPFRTNNTERARIDSSGNLLVGTTSYSNGQDAVALNPVSRYFSRSSTGSQYQIVFANPNGTIGRIETNGSSTSFVTSSDYRLKENIAPMTGALSVVQQLNPVTYNWKVDGSDGQGFIAHELQVVVPDAVTGQKDAVETYLDEDGIEQTRPVYQGIDTSFLVATLTAAIQELKAELDAAKADIATLKGAA